MLRHATLALAAAAATAAAGPARAETPVCTDRNVVLEHLQDQYSEAPVAMGVANNGGVVEILSSRSGASWTIILTMPNGVSCLIAAGESWESLPRRVSVGPAA